MADNTQRKLINSRTIVALLAFVGLNAALSGYMPKTENKFTADVVKTSANEQRQEGNWIWWITRNYIIDGTDADVVFMGSSQMGSALYASEAAFLNEAIDTCTHRKSDLASSLISEKIGHKPTTFNLSMGGAMCSDQYMMAKSLFNSEHKPKLVVLGVNPRDFIDNTMPSASATDAFRYLSPYVELDKLGGSAFPDLFAFMDWKINETLPTKLIGEKIVSLLPESSKKLLPNANDVVSEDGTVTTIGPVSAGNAEAGNAKTTDTKSGDTEAKSPAGEIASADGNNDALKAIYGNQGVVKPGEWRVVACSWGAFKDNTEEYRARYKNSNPQIFNGQKKFFEEYLAYLKNQDIKVLVVGMPSLWPNRALLPDKFWGDFRNYLSSTTTEYGAKFVDLTADERFDSKDYLDTVHLNSSGGHRLVELITDAISQDKKLAAAVSQSSIAKTDQNKWQ
ncbi:hypothetical protein KF728_11715 [Candidatus Obscuribacterales bacterium]|nr:hypothetical protein [Candidatus Obscuribacterales bacterium]MBX3150805.1 hypothetical protein [Candidatus Obscuribacterales bacterium]